MNAERKADMKHAIAPLTGMQMKQLQGAALAELLLGLGMLGVVLAWIYTPGYLTAIDALFALFKPSLTGSGLRTFFQSQVLLLMGIIMVISGIGIYLRRSWAWLMAQTVCLTVVLLSIQVIYILVSQGNPQASDSFLLPLMVFQMLQIGILVLLAQKFIRDAMQVSTIDIIVAALFACILVLDWNVTLYMLRAGSNI
jgi:hypothetical protein